MDLDKIKDTWQNAEIKSSINEDKIQQMLNNDGRSAYNYLLNYEKIGFVACFVLLALSIFMVVVKPALVPIYLAFSITLIGVWQGYKMFFLKSISLLEMNILEVSNKINTYRTYIMREWVVAVAWTLSICVLFIYDDIDFLYKVERGDSMFYIYLILKGIIIFSFTIGLTFLVYKLTLAKNVKKLDKAIKEVREFEAENK